MQIMSLTEKKVLRKFEHKKTHHNLHFNMFHLKDLPNCWITSKNKPQISETNGICLSIDFMTLWQF